MAARGELLVRIMRHPGLLPVNVYLVREKDGFTLVDAGLGGSERGIPRTARERGVGIRRIAPTCAHADHAGSPEGLRNALPEEAEVLVPAREARFLRGDIGLEPEERSRGKLRGSWKTAQTRPTAEVYHGDQVGSPAVAAAPGHAAFLDTGDGTLVAGDAFQARGGIAGAGVLGPLFPLEDPLPVMDRAIAGAGLRPEAGGVSGRDLRRA